MSIWTGLLFLDGAIADPTLARELADAEPPHSPPTGRRTGGSRFRIAQEKTMNVFKGLLYLLDADQPATSVKRRYGAATAAEEFGAALGNRAASEHRFGTTTGQRDAQLDQSPAAACH